MKKKYRSNCQNYREQTFSTPDLRVMTSGDVIEKCTHRFLVGGFLINSDFGLALSGMQLLFTRESFHVYRPEAFEIKQSPKEFRTSVSHLSVSFRARATKFGTGVYDDSVHNIDPGFLDSVKNEK